MLDKESRGFAVMAAALGGASAIHCQTVGVDVGCGAARGAGAASYAMIRAAGRLALGFCVRFGSGSVLE